MRTYFIKFMIMISAAAVLYSSCTTSPVADERSPLYEASDFADSDSRFIEIEGVSIHYKQYGSGGTTLLMLHGMLSNLESWKYLIPELSTEYRIAAYDRPAFGLSGRPVPTADFNPYSPEAYELQCLGLIDKLELGKPVLIGHSAGSNLALRLAVKYPDRFSGLVLISPGIYTEIPPAIIRELVEMGLLRGSGLDLIRSLPEHADEMLARNYYRPELPDRALKESYTRITGFKNWDTALLNFMMLQDDSILAEGITGIGLPAVIIQGLKDAVVPPADNLTAAGLMKNACLVYLPECGHVAQEEKPGQTLAVIRGFLESRM